jgi:hypothetical protein
MAPTRCSEKMSRSILEFFEPALPTFDTIADTIADLAGRKIFRTERRDCKAVT